MDCSFASLGAGIWTGCDGGNWDVDCSSVASPSQQAIRLSFLEYMNLNLNLNIFLTTLGNDNLRHCHEYINVKN